MGHLYVLAFPNGKAYVGITRVAAKRRLIGHMAVANCGSPFAVHRAIRKYGEPRLITVLSGDIEEMKEYEKSLIAEFGTKGRGGYNMTDGGDGSNGCVRTAETRRRLSAALTGRSLSSAHRTAIGKGNRGNVRGPRSEETKDKLRKALKGRAISDAAKATRSSPETRAKMSEAQKRRWQNMTDEQRTTSIERLNKPCSPETRAKMSASAKRRWAKKGQE